MVETPPTPLLQLSLNVYGSLAALRWKSSTGLLGGFGNTSPLSEHGGFFIDFFRICDRLSTESVILPDVPLWPGL